MQPLRDRENEASASSEERGAPTVGFGKDMRALFNFAPSYTPLNHGSYGTFPRAVLEKWHQVQRDVEARPCIFKRLVFPSLLKESRAAVARLLGARVGDVVLVPNASTGINTVLRNFVYEEGDVVLCFGTIYDACLKTVQSLGETTPLRYHVIDITYPLEADEVLAAFCAAVDGLRAEGKRVRFAIFDTIVSLPGVRQPWERLVAACFQYGILSLVDGAHGIGHLDLRHLATVDPDFFVSNCHKWLYVPRGCAVLYVSSRRQHHIATCLPTYHAYAPPEVRAGKVTSAYFADLFVDVATADTSPYLCVAAALRFRDEVCGGEAAIRDYCRRLARDGGDRAAALLGTEVLSDKSGFIRDCAFANVRLPLTITPDDGDEEKVVIDEGGEGGGGNRHRRETGDILLSEAQAVFDWIYETAMRDYDTYLQVKYYRGSFWVRLSAQVYLSMDDFEWAGRTMLEICERVKKGEWR